MILARSNGFKEEKRMRTMLFAVLVSALTLGSVIGVAAAEDSCRSKAIGKDGKPLAGAALSSFMTNVSGMLVSRGRSIKMGRRFLERRKTAS